jgi:hypothetical protein
MPYPLQIFHSDDHLLVAYQFAGASRIVNLGAPQPSAIDSWMGISNARWDGDTLVVDVIGFNDETWIGEPGTFHTDEMHVIERYSLINEKTLVWEATVEDPAVLAEPWKIGACQQV